MQATERLPRALREALARQDAPFVAAGLMPGNPRSGEAHLRLTASLLRDRQTSSPCARAVTHITTLFERSIPPSQQSLLACRSGCAFCCHQPVTANAAEVFFVASQLRERPDTVAAMEEALTLVEGKKADTPRVKWFRCPLLDDNNGCSVYRARPLACHAYVSVNVEDCKNAYPQEGSATVMEPSAYKPLRDLCRMLLLASMRVNGLPTTNYELNAAVTTALKVENAEKRWLRGGKISSATCRGSRPIPLRPSGPSPGWPRTSRRLCKK